MFLILGSEEFERRWFCNWCHGGAYYAVEEHFDLRACHEHINKLIVAGIVTGEQNIKVMHLRFARRNGDDALATDGEHPVGFTGPHLRVVGGTGLARGGRRADRDRRRKQLLRRTPAAP